MTKCYDIPSAREAFEEALDVLVQKIKQADQVSDEAALGKLIAWYLTWDIDAIFKVAQAAFEAGDFHTFNEAFEDAWKDYHHEV